MTLSPVNAAFKDRSINGSVASTVKRPYLVNVGTDISNIHLKFLPGVQLSTIFGFDQKTLLLKTAK